MPFGYCAAMKQQPDSTIKRVVHHDDLASHSVFGRYMERLRWCTSNITHRQVTHQREAQDARTPQIAAEEEQDDNIMTANWKWIVAVNILALLVSVACIYANTLPEKIPHVLQFVNFVNSFDDRTIYNVHHNQYLHGIYEPVHTEHFHIPVEVLEGAFPKNLDGLFLRLAANPLPSEVDRRYHIYDGHAMVHALRIQDGDAFYSNQWIRTNRFQLASKYNQSVLLQSGELSGWIGLWKFLVVHPLLKYAFRLRDNEMGNANTALLHHHHKLYACQETSLPFEIVWLEHNHSFASEGYDDFHGQLQGAVSAHSKEDPVDHRVYFNSNSVSWWDAPMHVGKWFRDKVEGYFAISQARRNSFARDFFITEHYMIVVESSFVFDVAGAIYREDEALKFDPERRLRMGVIPKNATSEHDITWFEFDRPHGFVHGINSWEERNGEEIVLFAPMAEGFRSSKIQYDNWPVFELRLNLKTKTAASEVVMGGSAIEFPVIHPNCVGRKCRFAFAVRFAKTKRVFDHIEKVDLFHRKFEKKAIKLPEGYVCGEPVIVPKGLSRGDRSDDVYIAVNALHLETRDSQWILYDGKTMDSQPVVRLRIPHRVPMDFHGLWLAEQDLKEHMQYADERIRRK